MKKSTSERELEDYICEHPKEAFGDGAEIVGRQISVKHGRLDLLVWDDEFGSICVAELKITQITPKDVAQTLRYFFDVWHTLAGVMVDGLQSYQMDVAYTTEWQRVFEPSWNGLTDGRMEATIVGPSIERNALAAALGAGCRVILWDHEDGAFSFRYGPTFLDEKRDNDTPLWAQNIEELALRFCDREKQSARDELEHHTELIAKLLNEEAT